ncbi:hypothetical protein [Kitasatospora cineracea]|uniref:hypothetical protein n=1 Tax=Kitasatospora cineracea TaxID=88074 RepID=UPI003407C566
MSYRPPSRFGADGSELGHCFFCEEDGLRDCRPIDVRVNEGEQKIALACTFHFGRVISLAGGLLSAA